MRSKLLLLPFLFLILATYGCTKAVNNAEMSDVSTGKVPTDIQQVKDDSILKPTPNTPAEILQKAEVPVLCYHRISESAKGDYSVSPATFETHMKVLADSGFRSVLPDQLYDYLVFNNPLPEKPVMISFDDSRTEHFTVAAPIMEKYGFRGAFFIMTITYNKKNYMSTEQIKELAEKGHTIGLHSWDHTMATKYKEETDWQQQVVNPKAKLEGIMGKPVDYWAYPNGVYDHQAATELGRYFKLSFILSNKRDSIQPLQTVRRMIVPELTPQGLLKSMKRTFFSE
jgi:peptidoglycan/xylan/chitin deacetylase (PgdA/CDA1 family)